MRENKTFLCDLCWFRDSSFQSCELNPSHSYTSNRQKHIPIAFSYHIVCSFDSKHNKFVLYRGIDCVKKFLKFLYDDVCKLNDILQNEVPMVFSNDDSIAHRRASHCHICNLPLITDKVRDHCHLTGRYRGAAHRYCNLRFRAGLSIVSKVFLFFG